MTDKVTIQEKLVDIQKNLHAPKSNKNSFGNYSYRSCEDIVEAVKPKLNGAILLISDEIVHFKSDTSPVAIEVIDNRGGKHTEIVGGDRFYVKATATITYNGESISTTAFAREPEEKKGMDLAQLTGATSSYARKYALNGLFAIDDTRDADSMDNRKTEDRSQYAPRPEVKDPEWIDAEKNGATNHKITNDTKLSLMTSLGRKGKNINDLHTVMQKEYKTTVVNELTEEQGLKLLDRIGKLPDKKEGVSGK